MANSNRKIYKTYSGYEPYVFFSYAHKDADKVLPIICMLDDKNYRLWYDAGIEVGVNWPEAVASHLLNSKKVLFFISENFLKSQNCLREVNYAVSEKKDMYCIFVEDVELPKDMAMQLSTVDKYNAYDKSVENTTDNIITKLGKDYLGDGVTGYEKIEKENASVNKWRILSIIFASLLLIMGILIFGYFNNWFSFAGTNSQTVVDENNEELEITEFKDSISAQVIMKAFNGNALYLCGNNMVSNSDAIRYKNNKWYIADKEVETGSFNDIKLISEKSELNYLSLVNESIDDLSQLKNLNNLIYLDISGNPCEDISFISSLDRIQVLKIIDMKINDYSVLKELSNLKYLYISHDMYDEVIKYVDSSLIDIIVK